MRPVRGARTALLLLVTFCALGTACASGPAPAGTGATAVDPAVSVELDPALNHRLPRPVRRSGVLTVATDASYAPASFFAPDGRTVIGFEPDLAAAMGRLLGLRVEFVVTDFVDALDSVRGDRVDVVISAMTDTETRRRQADFVNYFRAGTAVVVQFGNPHRIRGLRDLCGRRVAVERGTVQVDLLHRAQRRCTGAPIAVQQHETNTDALVELRTGRAAAVLNDYPPAVYLTSDPRTRDEYELASRAQYEPGLYGIAVAKDERRLRDALRAALERLVVGGGYHDILRAWGVADGAVRTVTVNAG